MQVVSFDYYFNVHNCNIPSMDIFA